MSSLSSVRRRRTAVMLGWALLALVGVGALLYAGGKALARYEGARDPSVEAVPIPVTPVGMLATVDVDDRLTGVTIFVNRPDLEAGGSIVSVPVSADTTGGGDVPRVPLTEVYATGGVDALVLGVESVLTVTINQFLVAGPDELASLLGQVAPIPADLPVDVVTTVAGDEVVLQEAGETNLSGEQAAEVLNAFVDGQTDAEHRPVVEAVWSGVVTAIGDGRTAASATEPTTFDDLANQVFAGPAAYDGLSATSIPAAERPDDADIEELDRAEAVLVFATVAPSNMSAPAPGLVFRIEAPPGHQDKVKWTIEALLYLGGNVQWVYQNGPVQPTTKVYLSDESLAQDALGAEGLFGDDVEQATQDVVIEGIDVIIQLGTSFLDDPDSGNTLPSTTTTTTVP